MAALSEPGLSARSTRRRVAAGGLPAPSLEELRDVARRTAERVETLLERTGRFPQPLDRPRSHPSLAEHAPQNPGLDGLERLPTR